jgi:hypothetical protein
MQDLAYDNTPAKSMFSGHRERPDEDKKGWGECSASVAEHA